MVIEDLIRDLAKVPGIVWVVGSGPVVSENSSNGMKAPDFANGSVTIEADNWHFHLNLDRVDRVEFVEQDDPHDARIPAMYLVRFAGAQGESPVRCYFPSPYRDDAGEISALQPEKLKTFEALRDAYAGREGITFVQRVKTTSS
ncbi:MAG: hypothetical protein IIC80_04185 [Chloroflexi bacterium]|nr:hypothetical protein [Chloroflexota bacterium]